MKRNWQEFSPVICPKHLIHFIPHYWLPNWELFMAFQKSTRFDTVIFLRKKVQGKNRSRNNQWLVWNKKGSSFGPLLWNVFQNDLHNTWWKLNIIHVRRQPSIKLSHAAETIKEVEQILNEERNKVSQWYDKDFLKGITPSRRFKCVPQILGLSSIHIFRLLFLPLSITFRRIHERNSFDLGAICLFCFKFCCLINFLIPIVTWWVLNLRIKILGLAC